MCRQEVRGLSTNGPISCLFWCQAHPGDLVALHSLYDHYEDSLDFVFVCLDMEVVHILVSLTETTPQPARAHGSENGWAMQTTLGTGPTEKWATMIPESSPPSPPHPPPRHFPSLLVS